MIPKKKKVDSCCEFCAGSCRETAFSCWFLVVIIVILHGISRILSLRSSSFLHGFRCELIGKNVDSSKCVQIWGVLVVFLAWNYCFVSVILLLGVVGRQMDFVIGNVILTSGGRSFHLIPRESMSFLFGIFIPISFPIYINIADSHWF